jgi:hypothetical protein
MAFHGDAQAKGRAVAAANYKARAIPRFWAKIDQSDLFGCWLWTGNKDKRGYGRIFWHGRNAFAHRVALGLSDGDWNNSLCVCHTCDVPACVNPAHLWRGSRLENNRDAQAKGRLLKPNRHFIPVTHCIHGHEYTPENTAWIINGKYLTSTCRECSRIRARIFHQRRRTQET